MRGQISEEINKLTGVELAIRKYRLHDTLPTRGYCKRFQTHFFPYWTRCVRVPAWYKYEILEQSVPIAEILEYLQCQTMKYLSKVSP